MNLNLRAAGTVAGVLAVTAIAATGVGVGAAATRHADVHAKAASKPATFQMYANVDAESDLGSNYDAVSAKALPGSTEDIVKFSKPIRHCAAVVQPGKAGGPDGVDYVSSEVIAAGKKSFDVSFAKTFDDGSWSNKREPFMLVVTCRT